MATFHENLVQSFKNFRDKYLKANNVIFQFSYDSTSGKFGYKDANGNFVPFRTVQASKTVTAGTSSSTVTPDSGYDGIASVTVNPTPSTSITPSNTSPASMSSGNLYNPSSSGYAISSYSSVSPSSSGTYFSSGMIKMGSSGYAYSSRPSSGYSYGWNSETTLWTNSSPSSSFGSQTISLNYSISNYSYIKFYYRAGTNSSTESCVIIPRSYFTSTGSGSSKFRVGLTYCNANSEVITRSALYVSNTSITFGSAFNHKYADTASNGTCIPTKVTGLS